jgi:hypothetical protein
MPTNSHHTNIHGITQAERELRRLADTAWNCGLGVLTATRPEFLRNPERRVTRATQSDESPSA